MFLECFVGTATSGIMADVLTSLSSWKSLATLATSTSLSQCFSFFGQCLTLNFRHWLILHVTLTGLRDTQHAGKTLFLDVTVRVFTE